MSIIDLTRLPSPEVLEQFDYEQILAEMGQQLNGLQPLLFDESFSPIFKDAELHTADNGEQYFKVPAQPEDQQFKYLDLESDPATKLLQIFAYREMLLRQRVNDGGLAVMLAFSTGADLEQIAARFGVTRLLITPEDLEAEPPVSAVYETDAGLRRRTQLALEGFSTAGPADAYVFHALSADADVKSVDVRAPVFALVELTQPQIDVLPEGAIVLTVEDDAGLSDPMPGDVAITILSNIGNGEATALIETVTTALNDKSVRPVTDRPRVDTAEIVEYGVTATLEIASGPDAQLVVDAATNALQSYVNQSHNLGTPVTLSAIYAALHQSGVTRVNLTEPVADIEVTETQAAFCNSISVSEA